MRQVDLDLDNGSFSRVGHSVQLYTKLPKLEPAQFTREDQNLHPDKPMTRVVKDILRVGRWKVGYDSAGNPLFWNVTPRTLEQIEKNFKLGQSRGIAMNLISTHGDRRTREVDIWKHGIAPMDQVFRQGDTLWMTAYVTPDQAKDLKNPVNKVSVRVVQDWEDGQGRSYDWMLLHTGVVDNPVVDSQGPFIDMSNKERKMARRNVRTSQIASNRRRNRRHFDLADDLPQGDAGAGAGDENAPAEPEVVEGQVDFARTLEAVNKLLPEGLTMPDNVTPENFNDVLDVIIQTLEQMVDDGQQEAEQAAANSLPGEPGGASPDAQLSDDPLYQMMLDLSNEVRQLRGQRENEARDEFIAELDALQEDGHINGVQRQQLIKKGMKFGYDLDLLDGLENRNVIDMSRVGKRHASGAPNYPNGSALTQDEVNEIIKSRGQDPTKIRFVQG